MDTDHLTDIWSRVFGTQPDPSLWLVIATAVLALGAVVPRTAWRLARNAVTIAHEGGHGLIALLTGRRLDGIRLHSDTSGLTVSRGKPTGLGMVLTAAMATSRRRCSVWRAPRSSPRGTSRRCCGAPPRCSWRC